MASALVYLCTDEIQHVEQPSMLTTMRQCKADMLQTLITGTIGPEPIYKNRLAPIQHTEHQIWFIHLAKFSELNNVCRWPHEWGYTKICEWGGCQGTRLVNRIGSLVGRNCGRKIGYWVRSFFSWTTQTLAFIYAVTSHWCDSINAAEVSRLQMTLSIWVHQAVSITSTGAVASSACCIWSVRNCTGARTAPGDTTCWSPGWLVRLVVIRGAELCGVSFSLKTTYRNTENVSIYSVGFFPAMYTPKSRKSNYGSRKHSRLIQ